MKKRTVLLCLFHGLVMSAVLPTRGGGEEVPNGMETPQILDEFDIAKGGDLILVPVTIADKPYPFVLATNRDRTFVDIRLRHLLGNPLSTGDGNGPLAHWQEFTPVPMKIGKTAFTAARALQCSDIARPLREVSGHDVYGEVGLDFLRDRVVQIDFDNGKLRVFAPDAVIPNPRGWVAHRMAGENVDQFPAVIQKVVGYGWSGFMIDTSWTGPIAVGSHEMTSLVKDGAIIELGTTMMDTYDGRRMARRGGRMRGLTALDCPPVPNLVAVDLGCSCVGLDYLSRFQLTLDFKRREVYLIPGAKFYEPVQDQWSGLNLALKNGVVTVIDVLAQSPADGVGIRALDVLVEVDQRPVSEYSLFQIRKLLSRPVNHTVTLRRGERDVSVRLQASVANGCDEASEAP